MLNRRVVPRRSGFAATCRIIEFPLWAAESEPSKGDQKVGPVYTRRANSDQEAPQVIRVEPISDTLHSKYSSIPFTSSDSLNSPIGTRTSAPTWSVG